jgi:hypothetical protein
LQAGAYVRWVLSIQDPRTRLAASGSMASAMNMNFLKIPKV